MEGQCAELPDGAEWAATIACHDCLGCILDDQQTMLFCDCHNGVHFAPDARVVHRHNCPGSRCNGGLNQGLVDIERIGANIDKHRYRTAQHKRVGCRNEGVGRHDDFVTRTDIGEDRRHFQGGCA